jgi:hypothetical protein
MNEIQSLHKSESEEKLSQYIDEYFSLQEEKLVIVVSSLINRSIPKDIISKIVSHVLHEQKMLDRHYKEISKKMFTNSKYIGGSLSEFYCATCQMSFYQTLFTCRSCNLTHCQLCLTEKCIMCGFYFCRFCSQHLHSCIFRPQEKKIKIV